MCITCRSERAAIRLARDDRDAGFKTRGDHATVRPLSQFVSVHANAIGNFASAFASVTDRETHHAIRLTGLNMSRDFQALIADGQFDHLAFFDFQLLRIGG